MLNDDKYFESDKLVNEVLTSEPDFFLDENFADVVAKRAERKFAWNTYINEFLIYLGVIFGIIVTMAVMIYFLYGENLNQLLNMLVSNIFWIAGINVLLVFILFADRVLLRYFMYRTSPQKNQFI